MFETTLDVIALTNKSHSSYTALNTFHSLQEDHGVVLISCHE